MYQALLTRRYLFRKVIPLLAMLSVAMCTAMVIIVLSVMGGFLNLVRESQRQLIGDVAVMYPVRGFPYYEELMARLGALPEVEATAAVIEAKGLVRMPYEEDQEAAIMGIDGPSFDRMTGYRKSLYWRPLTVEEARPGSAVDATDLRHPDNREIVLSERGPLLGTEADGRPLTPGQKEMLLTRLQDHAAKLSVESEEDGAVLGMEMSRYNDRKSFGHYEVSNGWWMPLFQVTVTVLPITARGAVVEPEYRVFPVRNEFFVGRYDIDSKVMAVPFRTLQTMLKMQAREVVTDRPELDEEGNPKTDEFGSPVMEREKSPAKCTTVMVKGKTGTELETLRQKVAGVTEEVAAAHPGEMPDVYVVTWEEQIEQFVAAVQKETALVTTLFSIISFVAVFLVLSIFWTIVQQKTRDIGILRSVGASRAGICWLFLRYGLVLGVLGSIVGGVIAHAVVWNINPIHEFLGRAFGIVIWDPKVYYFGLVPSVVDRWDAGVIMAGGVVFAVLGAMVPAIRAAWIDPVTALRYE